MILLCSYKEKKIGDYANEVKSVYNFKLPQNFYFGTSI